MGRRTGRRGSRRGGDLSRELAVRDRDALWALLVAAGAAPGARHRWASVGHLVQAVLATTGRGTRNVRAPDLERLLEACVAEEPRLTTLEDFVPNDPRDIVLTRLGDRVVRLLPGNVERPLADVDRALLVAEALDPSIRSKLGFGVQELVEVALDYGSDAISALAPTWPSSAFAGAGPAVISEGEIKTAAALVTAGTPQSVVRTDRHQRALDWATCRAEDLPYVPDHPQSPFGRYLRVVRREGEEPRWLPLAFLPEITGFGVTALAAEATDPDARLRFARAVARETRRALWRFSTTVLGPDDDIDGPVVSPGNVVQWVAMSGGSRAVMVQIVARPNLTSLPFNSEPAAVKAAREADGVNPTRIPLPGGLLQLPPHVEVVPLLIVASAGHVVAPQGPQLPGMSLDDLRWAASTADATTDLFTFCRDMTRPGLPRFFAWEAINIWEWWRSNGKSFFSGGQAPTMVMLAPHMGEAEWTRAAERAQLEQALATLQLPPLRDALGVDHEATGPPAVYWTSP